ncbi:MAG TPA: hypothetical protein VNI77_05710 [Nitrososphaera sp.]|nr:hypothetical protein [Nitrososphaera sp.]
MKRASFSAILILAGLCVLASLAQTDQTEKSVSDILERQVTTSDVEYLTPKYAFNHSLVSARVPGGIINMQGCSDEPAAQIASLPQATLRETLEAIVQKAPQYRWLVDEGVVNLLPVDDEPELLKVRISKLRVKNAISINVALNKLFALPEVKNAIEKLQLSPGVQMIKRLVSLNPNPPRYNIECKDMTVREALNTIARSHGQAVWEYRERRCEGKVEYGVSFIVQ